jgi:hypothetical protein
MKTSARMRSVSQSVQPEDPPSAKKQKTAPAKPKERTKRQPSIVEEEVESDVEEPVVEKPRRRLLPSLSLRRRPRRTSRSLQGLRSARSVLIVHTGTSLISRPHLSMTNPRMETTMMYPHPRRRLEPPHAVSALNHPRSANRSARPMTISQMTIGRSRNHSRL